MNRSVSSKTNSLKEKCYKISNHPAFLNTIISLIFFNAIIIGLETYPSIYKPNSELFYITERLLLWIFSIEIAIRIAAEKKWTDFFRNSWNNFDFIIVASTVLLAGIHFVSLLRILRVLRILRALTVVPSLQKLVQALMTTIPSMGNIMLLMGLIFYIFGVLGTFLFREAAPELFGSLHASLLTLFQVVTLESWATEVMRPINQILPWAWIYFLSFVLVGTFVVINLFVGVIVNNVQQANIEMVDKSQEEDKSYPSREDFESLKEEIVSLKLLLTESRTQR